MFELRSNNIDFIELFVWEPRENRGLIPRHIFKSTISKIIGILNFG